MPAQLPPTGKGRCTRPLQCPGFPCSNQRSQPGRIAQRARVSVHVRAAAHLIASCSSRRALAALVVQLPHVEPSSGRGGAHVEPSLTWSRVPLTSAARRAVAPGHAARSPGCDGAHAEPSRAARVAHVVAGLAQLVVHRVQLPHVEPSRPRRAAHVITLAPSTHRTARAAVLCGAGLSRAPPHRLQHRPCGGASGSAVVRLAGSRSIATASSGSWRREGRALR